VVHSERRRGKSRSRILYWFRTPPGVKVGRAALDEDAIRLLEELNPSVEFDWTRILKGQGVPPAEQRVPVEPRRSRRPSPHYASAPAIESAPPEEPGDETVDAGVDIGLEAALEAGPDRASEPPEPAKTPMADVSSPAHARMGSEAMERLRARHAAMLRRIAERVADPIRREEMIARADRLNPDTWVTDAEVTRGLEEYESVLASLSEVVGRRRKRRRRGQRGPSEIGASEPGSEVTALPAAAADLGADAPTGAKAAEVGALGESSQSGDFPEGEGGENDDETPENSGL
jgi:hypothetical protein